MIVRAASVVRLAWIKCQGPPILMFQSINSSPAGIMKQIPQWNNTLLLSNSWYHLLHAVIQPYLYADAPLERGSLLTAWGMTELSVTCVTKAISLR